MKKIFVVLFLFSSCVALADEDPNVTIAKEYMSEKKFSQAIESCKEALQEDATNKDCLEITKQANASLSKAKATAIAAQHQQQEKEKMASAKQSSKECELAKLKSYYCDKKVGLGNIQAAIDQENRVGRESGYVNAYNLNKYTQSKIYVQSELDGAKKRIEALGRSPASVSDNECGVTKAPEGHYYMEQAKHDALGRIESVACGAAD